MLFDLRGAGRRNTVRVIYLGLAILMGGGLVLFGVGGSVGGGALDALKSNNGNGNANGSTFEARVKKLEARVKANPKDAPALAQLAQARFQETNTPANFDTATSTYTPAGKAQLQTAAAAWDSYLALNPKKPDLNVARVMVQVFSPSALNDPAKAVSAEELVIDNSKPQSTDLKQLAALAYLAGQTRKGDLATEKAVALAPKAERKALRVSLKQYKTQVAAAQAQQSSPSGSTVTASP